MGMGAEMQIKNNNFPSIEQVTGQYLKKSNTGVNTSESTKSFSEVLQQTYSDLHTEQPDSGLSELKFSKHAGERLAQRDISLTEEQLQRLEDGAQKASAKGIKESLVLMDNLAFIVNTQNHTVVTAMNQSNDNDNIFTNIDGAVVV